MLIPVVEPWPRPLTQGCPEGSGGAWARQPWAVALWSELGKSQLLGAALGLTVRPPAAGQAWPWHSTCGVAEAQEDLGGDTGAGRVGNGFWLIPKPRLGTAGVRLIQAHPSVDCLPVTGQEGPPHMATPHQVPPGTQDLPISVSQPWAASTPTWTDPPSSPPQGRFIVCHAPRAPQGCTSPYTGHLPGQYFAPCTLCWPLMVWGGVLPLGWAGGPTRWGLVPSPPLLR